MARVRTAKHPKPEEHAPEDENQEPPEQEAAPEAANDNNQPSKADMVRAAIADGMDTPGDGTAWIKAHYGVDMPRQLWSSYLAQQKARERKAVGGETAPRTRTVSPMQPTAIPAGFSSDVREIRELVERLGGIDMFKETVGQLSGLIGKYGAGGLTEIAEAIG